jgi:hypothetical protein
MLRATTLELHIGREPGLEPAHHRHEADHLGRPHRTASGVVAESAGVCSAKPELTGIVAGVEPVFDFPDRVVTLQNGVDSVERLAPITAE